MTSMILLAFCAPRDSAVYLELERRQVVFRLNLDLENARGLVPGGTPPSKNELASPNLICHYGGVSTARTYI
jgi:hypothetical protein